MNSIKIENNVIDYQSEFFASHKDKSWILDLDNVEVIGGINRMNGDDDSDFIVFIDLKLQKYFLNLTWEIEGFKKFKELFELKFGIGLNDWSIDFYDDEKVIYPMNLSGSQLFQSSWKKKFRTVLAIDHASDGELSEKVIDFIENKKTSANKV